MEWSSSAEQGCNIIELLTCGHFNVWVFLREVPNGAFCERFGNTVNEVEIVLDQKSANSLQVTDATDLAWLAQSSLQGPRSPDWEHDQNGCSRDTPW